MMLVSLLLGIDDVLLQMLINIVSLSTIFYDRV